LRRIKNLLRGTFLYKIAANIYDDINYYRAYLRVLRQIDAMDEQKNRFFFLPFFHTGGAEKVHLNILQLLRKEECVIFFTGKSYNSDYREAFENSAQVIDLDPFIRPENRFLRQRITRKIVRKVNRSRSIIFSSNSPYFYDILPLFSPKVKK